MHREVLVPEQEALLPLLQKFSKDFGLVGGTAIALHIGHRRSIDFDLFTARPFDAQRVRRKIVPNYSINRVFRDWTGEYTIVVDGVKVTFFHYPFPITFSEPLGATINLPNLLTLAAMKAYALGRRAKWKDYVDLFFILRDHHPITAIVRQARSIFGVEFNEKIFRAALTYFDDVDRSETVDYLKGFAVRDTVVQKRLAAWSVSA